MKQSRPHWRFTVRHEEKKPRWLEPGETYHTFETLLTAALKLLNRMFCSGQFPRYICGMQWIFLHPERDGNKKYKYVYQRF